MKKYSLIIIAVLSIIMFWACNNKASEGHAEADAHGEHEEYGEHEEQSTASLSSEQAKSIQLEISSIEKKQLTASLRANGTLNVPNQNKATITSLMGGVISSILVQSGNNIEKGQVIATIANTSFIGMQEDFLSTSSALALAEIEFKRQQDLQAGNAGALKNMQTAESELKALRAKKMGLQKQLQLIGINTEKLTVDNMQSYINVVSPISGAIGNLSVNIGSYIDANNAIGEVIDNSQIHLDLFVYERDLSKLKEGQTIHFTLTNNPGKEYDAIVYAVSNTFEQNSKAIAVHAKVEGDKVGLINGMSITAIVSLENAQVDAVPTDAIVNFQGQDYIFVLNEEKAGAVEKEKHADEHAADEHQKADLSFERVPVRKGTTDVGYSEITILKDVLPNAKIASKGAFFILAKMTNSGEHEH